MAPENTHEWSSARAVVLEWHAANAKRLTHQIAGVLPYRMSGELPRTTSPSAAVTTR